MSSGEANYDTCSSILNHHVFRICVLVGIIRNYNAFYFTSNRTSSSCSCKTIRRLSIGIWVKLLWFHQRISVIFKSFRIADDKFQVRRCIVYSRKWSKTITGRSNFRGEFGVAAVVHFHCVSRTWAIFHHTVFRNQVDRIRVTDSASAVTNSTPLIFTSVLDFAVPRLLQSIACRSNRNSPFTFYNVLCHESRRNTSDCIVVFTPIWSCHHHHQQGKVLLVLKEEAAPDRVFSVKSWRCPHWILNPQWSPDDNFFVKLPDSSSAITTRKE